MTRNWQIVLGILAAIVVVWVGVALFGAATGGSKAPKLEVSAPAEGAQISAESVTVKGKTDKGSEVRVNNQPAKLGSGGSFSVSVPLETGQSFVFVKSTRHGKDTIVQRSVTRTAGSVPSVSAGSESASAPAAPAAPGAPLSASGPSELVTILGLALVGSLGIAWRKTAQSIKG